MTRSGMEPKGPKLVASPHLAVHWSQELSLDPGPWLWPTGGPGSPFCAGEVRRGEEPARDSGDTRSPEKVGPSRQDLASRQRPPDSVTFPPGGGLGQAKARPLASPQ